MIHPENPTRQSHEFATERSGASTADVLRLDGYERGARADQHIDTPIADLKRPMGLEQFVARIDQETEFTSELEPGSAPSRTHGAAPMEPTGGEQPPVSGPRQSSPSAPERDPGLGTVSDSPRRTQASEPSAAAAGPEIGKEGRESPREVELEPAQSWIQSAGERQTDLERMERVMSKVSRALPMGDPTLLDTSEQLDFIRRVGLAIAELDWYAQGTSTEHMRLASALMNYRYQLQGLTRDLNRSNKVIAKVRREKTALDRNIENARRVARQLGNSRRHLRSNRNYESELRKVILLQDRLLELVQREAKEQYLRRGVMRKAYEMNEELRGFAKRLEAHAGRGRGATGELPKWG